MPRGERRILAIALLALGATLLGAGLGLAGGLQSQQGSRGDVESAAGVPTAAPVPPRVAQGSIAAQPATGSTVQPFSPTSQAAANAVPAATSDPLQAFATATLALLGAAAITVISVQLSQRRARRRVDVRQ